MTRSIRQRALRATLALVPLLVAGLTPLASHADEKGHHPAYLHALSDLRTARTLIAERGGDAKVSVEEKYAIEHLDKAIGEVTEAAKRDGKNIKEEPKVDVKPDHAGNLHHADELLTRARKDISEKEDDAQTVVIRDRALVSIDAALQSTHKAISDFEMHK